MPGLKLEDLLGARSEVQIVSARTAKVEGKDCLVFTALHDGSEVRYGILPDIIDKVLAAGHKDSEGKMYLRLPAPDKTKRINWITAF